MTARLSVVIPAHDEESLIGAALGRMLDSPRSGELEIVVVANGCTDATADVARATSNAVAVVEIGAASKIAALNAGDAAATVLPRAYVDADASVTTETLLALADALGEGGALVASPRLVVDTSRASWPVRQYYRIWELTDYRSSGHIGSGVYALSAAGRARFDEFPDVIADDLFVQTRFDESERATIDESFAVASPRTFSALVRRATRIAVGNMQLAARDGSPAGARPRIGSLVRRVAVRPGLWVAFAVYCVGYATARARAARRFRREGTSEWHRDHTTRTSA